MNGDPTKPPETAHSGEEGETNTDVAKMLGGEAEMVT